MDMAATWPGRILIFFLAFPVAMFGIPFLIASLRQKLSWNKGRPADRMPPSAHEAQEPDPLTGRRGRLVPRQPQGRFPA